MAVRPLGTFIVVADEQPLKVPTAIEVTLSGMMMLVRLVHFSRAYSSIVVTLFGMVMLVMLEQLSKARLPIEVTPSPTLMLVRLSQN